MNKSNLLWQPRGCPQQAYMSQLVARTAAARTAATGRDLWAGGNRESAILFKKESYPNLKIQS